MNRIDDSDPAPGYSSVNRLRILQVRGHSGALIYEPRAKMGGRVPGIASLLCELPCRNQRRNLYAEAHQVAAMVVEVVWIRHPVALNVWAARILRVRPPVVALREVIVRSTRASRAGRCCNCGRRFGQIPIRGL